MTPWRFKGAAVQAAFTNRARRRFDGAVSYFAAGAAAGGGAAARRGAALPAVVGAGAAGAAAAAAWGWAAGLIQQAWMRSSRLRGTLSSIWSPKRVRQRKARLDMAAGAAEPVVEVEVAEGGIEVVPPHQADHAAAEPDAFGVAGRAVDGLLGLGEFVGFALVVLGAVGGCGGGVLPC